MCAGSNLQQVQEVEHDGKSPFTRKLYNFAIVLCLRQAGMLLLCGIGAVLHVMSFH